CCISRPEGPIGAEIRLEGKSRLDELLFGEAPTRVIVSAPAECRARLEQMAHAASVPVSLIGRAGGARLSIAAGGGVVVDLEVGPARSAWRAALAGHLKG